MQHYKTNEVMVIGRLRSRSYNMISQVKAYTSPSDRCQMTLQTVLAGAFPPTTARSRWNSHVNWQAIPYESSVPLLRMTDIKCPGQYVTTPDGRLLDDSSPTALAWLGRDKPLTQYAAQQTGLNASKLNDLADLADNIIDMVSKYLTLSFSTHSYRVLILRCRMSVSWKCSQQISHRLVGNPMNWVQTVIQR